MIIKPGSIKVNYALNIIRLLLNILVLTFTMPYVSRVLGSEGVGRVEYAYAIIEYFFLFSALGIPMYGIRQIAKCRDDIQERSRVVIELLIILLTTTVLSFIVLFIIIYTFEYTPDFKDLLILLSAGIVLSNLGLEWFYQGIENQKFITVRHVFIKVFSVTLLYLMVKTKADTYFYAVFLIITNFGGSIFNLAYLRKFIVFEKKTLTNLDIKRHLRPSLTIFLASVSISFYMQLDKIMLGSMVSDAAVGYYAQATKLPRMMIVLVTTMGAVMLPRLSNLIETGKKEEYTQYMAKSLRYILLVAVPGSLLFIVLSKEIILVMAGPEFIPSITTMKILAPIIFLVALAYYIGFQVLYPLGKEKIYTMAVTIAGVVNFIFNYFTIKYLKQDGAALGTLLAEAVGLIIMMYAARKKLAETNFFSPYALKYFTAGTLMAITIYICSFLNLPPLFQLFVSSAAGLLVYAGTLFVLKESIVTESLQLVLHYIKRDHNEQ
jgi:O-antigen/teichoic acid export membrane protein